ncbi:MAG: molecular chaperone TorD family protein [Raoultibacter sp.]
MNTSSQNDILIGQTCALDFLANVLYEAPSKELVERLVTINPMADFPFASHNHTMQLAQKGFASWVSNPEPFEALAKDHMSLFEGPEKPMVPPWESSFFSKDDLLFQEQAVQVKSWFSTYGLQLASRQNEPMDHIAFELEFCSYLTKKSLRASNEHNCEEEKRFMQSEKQFFSEHLGSWGIPWAKNLAEAAKTVFFKSAALFLIATLEETKAVLDAA